MREVENIGERGSTGEEQGLGLRRGQRGLTQSTGGEMALTMKVDIML